MLRDVREGVAAPAPTKVGHAGAGAGARKSVAAPRPADPPDHELAGQILGKAVVIIPAIIFAVVAVGITEPQFEGMGWPIGLSWMASFASVVITLGVAAAWGYARSKGPKR
jgi:hypothetical protein